MRKLKQSISCVLVFLMVLSAFTILPNQFFNGLGVSAVDLPTEKSNEVKTNSAESGEEATYVYNDFIYSIINDNEVKIVGYFGGSSDVVVPNAITNSNSSLNKKITTIGNGAFKSAGITSVTLGNNIVHIEDYAFYKNNKLKKVDL